MLEIRAEALSKFNLENAINLGKRMEAKDPTYEFFGIFLINLPINRFFTPFF